MPHSAWLQVLCSGRSSATGGRGQGWRRGSLRLGKERSYHSCLLFGFFCFSFLNALRTPSQQHAAWMGRGLPPQLTPGLLRPSFPSRSRSGVFSPTFGPAHQGCSLAEKRTWPPASFLYLSRVSQCLVVPSASSARSLVTAKPGQGGHPLCPFLWLRGSFQCLWRVPPAPSHCVSLTVWATKDNWVLFVSQLCFGYCCFAVPSMSPGTSCCQKLALCWGPSAHILCTLPVAAGFNSHGGYEG